MLFENTGSVDFDQGGGVGARLQSRVGLADDQCAVDNKSFVSPTMFVAASITLSRSLAEYPGFALFAKRPQPQKLSPQKWD